MDFVDTTQVLGNLGEFFGAIAVFATLSYLAVQIRQNTKAQRSADYDSSIRNFTEVRQALFESSELSAIYVNGSNDPESLNEADLVRYRLLMNNILISFWHIHNKPADLPEDLWATQLPAVLRVLSCPGGRWFWENYRTEFVPSFRNEIEKTIAANPVELAIAQPT
jgi:hypothetical protein